MIPRTTSGRGFKGAAAYYLHDKGAETAARIRFTHMLNLSADDPHRAIAEMIYTAAHADDLKAASGVKATGRKLEKPVYAFSLSWHPTEQPTDAQMKEAGIAALKALKMDHHQVLMVAHNDTQHPHVHLIVNRIDPLTGKAHGLNKDQLILSKWALAYEKEHGKTWCAAREQNAAERRKAAREKAEGKRRDAIVKDRASQARDRRPEFNRRSKAIEARRAAEREKAVIEAALAHSRFSIRVAAETNAAQWAAAAQRAQEQQREAEIAAQADRARAIEEAARQDAKAKAAELYRAPEIVPPEDPKKAEAAFRAQQAEDAKRRKFAEWQTRLKNDLQEKQQRERDALARQFHERREQAEARIEKTYGKARRADEKRLAEIAQREIKGSRLSRFIDKAKGLDAEREAIEKTLADIEMRSQEILTPLLKQEKTAFALLDDQQRQEDRSLNALFERQAGKGYEIPPEPSRGAERDAGRERGGGKGDGHGRGRGPG